MGIGWRRVLILGSQANLAFYYYLLLLKIVTVLLLNGKKKGLGFYKKLGPCSGSTVLYLFQGVLSEDSLAAEGRVLLMYINLLMLAPHSLREWQNKFPTAVADRQIRFTPTSDWWELITKSMPPLDLLLLRCCPVQKCGGSCCLLLFRLRLCSVSQRHKGLLGWPRVTRCISSECT